MSSFESTQKVPATVDGLEIKLRESARKALDRLARLVASLAVSLNRLAETVGRTAQEPEPRDGVIPEPPAAA